MTGVYHKYTKTLLTRDISSKSKHTREKSQSLMVEAECSDCHGKRLNAAALNCKINGYSIADLCEMELTELRDVLSEISNPQTELLIYTLIEGLDRMIEIGPDVGKNGGEVVFAGTLKEMVESARTLTANSLRASCCEEEGEGR